MVLKVSIIAIISALTCFQHCRQALAKPVLKWECGGPGSASDAKLGNPILEVSLNVSIARLKNIIIADDNKGRDYASSAEGASNYANLSGKRTLVGRSSGERFT